jgi:hypothetical protein
MRPHPVVGLGYGGHTLRPPRPLKAVTVGGSRDPALRVAGLGRRRRGARAARAAIARKGGSELTRRSGPTRPRPGPASRFRGDSDPTAARRGRRAAGPQSWQRPPPPRPPARRRRASERVLRTSIATVTCGPPATVTCVIILHYTAYTLHCVHPTLRTPYTAYTLHCVHPTLRTPYTAYTLHRRTPYTTPCVHPTLHPDGGDRASPPSPAAAPASNSEYSHRPSPGPRARHDSKSWRPALRVLPELAAYSESPALELALQATPSH